MSNIQLPVIVVQGKVVESNLDSFRASALEFIGAINKNLVTDNDFAEAAKNVKACGDSEKALEKVKADVISQTADIAMALDVINDVQAKLRATRLELDKTVKSEKDRRKKEVIDNGLSQLKVIYSSSPVAFHLGQPSQNLILEAVKGKSSFDGMNVSIAEVVESETERVFLIEETFLQNTEQIDKAGKPFLFPDKNTIAVTSSASELSAIIESRIAKHEIEEMKKAENERLEKERLEQLAQKEAEKKAEVLPVVEEPAQQTKAPEPISGGVIKQPEVAFSWPEENTTVRNISFVFRGEPKELSHFLILLETNSSITSLNVSKCNE